MPICVEFNIFEENGVYDGMDSKSEQNPDEVMMEELTNRGLQSNKPKNVKNENEIYYEMEEK